MASERSTAKEAELDHSKLIEILWSTLVQLECLGHMLREYDEDHDSFTEGLGRMLEHHAAQLHEAHSALSDHFYEEMQRARN